jgi:uncharacterized membrane protein YjjP (DUF1212 family)
VLDLAMRAGDLLLSAGMSASDVVATMHRIISAYGLVDVHVDVTYTAIMASHHPAAGSVPATYTRVARPGDVDYSQARGLFRLSRAIQDGLPLPLASERLERIRSASHPYPPRVATAANAAVGAGVVLLFTTSWMVIVATFLIGCVVDRMLDWLASRGLPPFFRQIAGAAVITVVAAGAAAAGSHGVRFLAGLNPNLVVIGGIIMLLAGTVMVAAAQDAISEFYVTASARMIEVAMRTTGLVLGIVIAIRLTSLLRVPLSISAGPVSLGPLAAQFAGAAVTPAFFAVYAYGDGVMIGLAAALGLTGWAGFAVVLHAGWGEVPASAVAALAVALVATLLTRVASVPGFALVNAAIVPLVPGLSLYTGLLDVLGTPAHKSAPATGVATLFTAVAIAVAIASGASLGTYLGRPMAGWRHQTRARARRA